MFQTGAAAGLNTTDIWSSLREAAGASLFQAQGVAQPYDPAAVQAAGAQILSQQGVNAATVSTFRGLAGQWNQARANLGALEPDQQITPSAIFQPPWATTNDPNVPSRYRIRTQWQFESATGAVFTQWVNNQIDGPLLGTADALSQAPPPKNTYPPQQILADAGPPSLLGFEIEQI